MGDRQQHRVVTTWVNNATAARLCETVAERHVSVSTVIADIIRERADRLETLRPVDGDRSATMACYQPRLLVAEVDRAAASACVTRSQLIADALSAMSRGHAPIPNLRSERSEAPGLAGRIASALVGRTRIIVNQRKR